MSTLLKINSSLYSDDSQSSKLADAFIANWLAANPETKVIARDLGRDPIPHLDALRFGAFITKPESRTLAQQEAVNYSDRLIEELQRADTIVLGLPMYNFGIPSTLKAYFDQVARAGITFRYSEQGPVGLLKNKKAYVVATRGGFYAGTPRDSQTAYIRDFLRFIGIDDVEFVYAEGLAMGEEQKSRSLTAASQRLAELAPERHAVAA